MTTVRLAAVDAAGTPAARVAVFATLVGEGALPAIGYTADGAIVTSRVETVTGITGLVDLDLTPNANIDPGGTVYLVEYVVPGQARHRSIIDVPAGGPFDLAELLTIAPGQLAPVWTVEPWHNVGAVGEPALLHHWTANVVIAGGIVPVPPVSFYKDALDRVHLRGALAGAPGAPNPFATPAFILPPAYRPSTTVVIDAANSDLAGGTGVAIVFVMGLDANVGAFPAAVPGAVIPVFATYNVATFLDGGFRSAA